jgi:spore cortex formation protein SpoVR/YcgB (stage V sporulation)
MNRIEAFRQIFKEINENIKIPAKKSELYAIESALRDDVFPADMINATVTKEITLFEYCTQKGKKYMMFELKTKDWTEVKEENAAYFLS